MLVAHDRHDARLSVDETSTKRPLSPNVHHKKIEYLIRDELDRACPTLVKRDGQPFDDERHAIFSSRPCNVLETGCIFQKPSASQSPNASKRLR